MGFFTKKLEDPKETQIIGKNLQLDELISPEILKELKEKFSDNVELIPSLIKFQIIPKQQPLKELSQDGEQKQGLKIIISQAEFINLEHPSPKHHEEKIIVITSNKNAILKKFLE